MSKEQNYRAFISNLTKELKENKFHMLAFSSDGERISVTHIGDKDILVQAVAAVMAEAPEFIGIIAEAIDFNEKNGIVPVRDRSEDDYANRVIDMWQRSKDLNKG